jgi:rhodanese-related sulfurtransferase
MVGRRSRCRQLRPRDVAAEADRVVLLDVREPDEWRAGHIDGSLHVPMGSVGSQLESLDAATPIVAVCRSGRRSLQVAEALARRGFDVANLDGGLLAWQQAGLPLTAADGGAGQVA